MSEFSTWIEQHPGLFFAFVLFQGLGGLAFSLRRRQKAGPTHPPFSKSDVCFSETYVSGSSDKNLFTRFGGARNALSVTVLKEGLLVEPSGIFKWVVPY